MVTNYRPISLLSIFNKILERLMYNRLIKYFEKSSTIFYQQFGICSSHSTGHALLLLIDKIQKAIDSKTIHVVSSEIGVRPLTVWITMSYLIS